MSLTTFSTERAGAQGGRQADSTPKVTVPSLLEKKLLRRPISAITAYDYASARLVDEAGLDVVLVGDSLAMVMQGHENTLAVTMDEMLLYTRGVRRAVRRALLVADMPFGSYHTDDREALANAIRFVKESGAEAVKLEGGRERAELIRRITAAEIPVMGHIGLTPQSVHRMGGYKVQGKTMQAIDELRTDALALEEAGCFAIVLEGVPRELAHIITEELRIPTIGIGAGPDCDGQILVLHDMMSMTFSPPAKFVRRYADVAGVMRKALEEYRHDVEARTFPADAESYHFSREVRELMNESTESAEPAEPIEAVG
ncbi:3-methyl-2-oxobutanoate hydroxymethyltransferase [Tunturibacter empetritectus]|uniref:3-methyl-2-oxobutanoate hydroxymethyltransferase n=1 Tax=Tunturiibacter lichenicola TaxID=2051959 RepID=A0A7W8J8U0_9BACT|nr:3-methyl-2-oxobutanoate hydroxymethyltransferase [Edaphobacter lichenicola]MBB5344784.1 3-methyl-2-oxobutanoate hydroxymethyltransferase [Edaphobacter lichenicola]